MFLDTQDNVHCTHPIPVIDRGSIFVSYAGSAFDKYVCIPGDSSVQWIYLAREKDGTQDQVNTGHLGTTVTVMTLG